MNLSVTQAAKDWGLSRTTIYQKISSGKLSRRPDKKIDMSEMIRVFGEPNIIEQKKVHNRHVLSNVQKKPVDNSSEQKIISELQHKLEIEQLKNEYLREQVASYKLIIEDYQRQINQLNNNLAQATSSINEFAQTRLLELKQDTEGTKMKENVNSSAKKKIEEIPKVDSRTSSKVNKKSRLKTIANILIGIN